MAFIRGATITCTPEQLLDDQPCTLCESESEIMAVIAFILCKMNAADADADCSAATLADDAKCFSCLDDKQLLAAAANSLYDYAVAQGYLVAGNLRSEATCLRCLEPKYIKAILVHLLCTYLSNLLNPQ